jgi:cytochrome P450
VCVSSWAASHSPENFVNPDKFIPERWMSSDYDSDQKKASQPFSLGPRGCIGRNLTYVELRLILGALLWNFDLEFVDGAPLWNPANEYAGLRAFNTWEKSPLLIKLTDIRV